MHIAIINLTSGGLSGGYRKYLRKLLPVMLQDPRVARLSVFSPDGSMDEGSDHWAWPRHDARRGFAALRHEIQRRNPDVAFFPTARSLVLGRLPVAVMVRNMEPLIAPFGSNRLSEGLKNLARRRVARISCGRAERVIAVSDFVYQFLVTEWALSGEKLGIVRHGIEPALTIDQAAEPVAIDRRLTGPFLFAAGSIRPARGLEDVIRALAMLVRSGRAAQLVIAGVPTPDSVRHYEQLFRLARKLGIHSQIIWAGHLSPQQMSWCFLRCAAFVMTSRVEACPNVALEAMSHGAPCISTSNRPMPEFFGDAAYYYPAGDAEALGQRVGAVLDVAHAGELAALRRAGVTRAAAFTWERTARETVTELARCMGVGVGSAAKGV
jgi:glycosyltransferase involved in cell wall biosynthesis